MTSDTKTLRIAIIRTLKKVLKAESGALTEAGWEAMEYGFSSKNAWKEPECAEIFGGDDAETRIPRGHDDDKYYQAEDVVPVGPHGRRTLTHGRAIRELLRNVPKDDPRLLQECPDLVAAYNELRALWLANEHGQCSVFEREENFSKTWAYSQLMHYKIDSSTEEE